MLKFRTYAQISHEFTRFSKHLKNVKVATFFGGLPITANKQELKDKKPAIVVGTPGRLKQVCDASCTLMRRRPYRLSNTWFPVQLAKEKDLQLSSIKHFIIDECDKVLEGLGASPSSVETLFINYPDFSCLLRTYICIAVEQPGS